MPVASSHGRTLKFVHPKIQLVLPMASLNWTETPTLWTASLGEVPVCALKAKDIGGCTASWLDDRLWSPPSHLPKAKPQPTRFFSDFAEAKLAVEQQLKNAA
jgi:hypothetical protein